MSTRVKACCCRHRCHGNKKKNAQWPKSKHECIDVRCKISLYYEFSSFLCIASNLLSKSLLFLFVRRRLCRRVRARRPLSSPTPALHQFFGTQTPFAHTFLCF
jgi:hypothetical protein